MRLTRSTTSNRPMAEQPPYSTGLGVKIDHERKPPPPTPPRADMWQGFGVLDRGGNLVWGTLRPTEADAVSMYRRWNPQLEGHPMGEKVVKIRINIENLPLQRDLL